MYILKVLLFNAHKSGGRGPRQKRECRLRQEAKQQVKRNTPFCPHRPASSACPHLSPGDCLLHKLKRAEALWDLSGRRASLAELIELIDVQLGLNDGGVVVLGPVGEVHDVRRSAVGRLLPIDRTTFQLGRRTANHLPVVEPVPEPAEGPVAQAHVVAAAAVLLVADGTTVGPRVAAALEVPVGGDGPEGATTEEYARVDAAARVGVVVGADVAAAGGAAAPCELEVDVDGRGGRGEETGDEGEGLHVG